MKTVKLKNAVMIRNEVMVTAGTECKIIREGNSFLYVTPLEDERITLRVDKCNVKFL